VRTIIALAVLLCTAGNAAAQVRGFADVGLTSFAATQSFDATFGTHSGPVFGGGVEVDVPRGLFLSLRASRFTHDGHRLFVFDGQQFDLGIPTTVTITPIELAGGYRFPRLGRVVPYGGGGVSWHRYKETSRGAVAAENVDKQFAGFQLLGGGEFRIATWLAGAAEAQWTSVRDALGSNVSSVAAAFDEHDLGGFTVRTKVIIGR